MKPSVLVFSDCSFSSISEEYSATTFKNNLRFRDAYWRVWDCSILIPTANIRESWRDLPCSCFHVSCAQQWAFPCHLRARLALCCPLPVWVTSRNWTSESLPRAVAIAYSAQKTAVSCRFPKWLVLFPKGSLLSQRGNAISNRATLTLLPEPSYSAWPAPRARCLPVSVSTYRQTSCQVSLLMSPH